MVLLDFAAFRTVGGFLQPLKSLLASRKDVASEKRNSLGDRKAGKEENVVVWIDDKITHSNAAVMSMIKDLQQHMIKVVMLLSTTKFKEWCEDQGRLYEPQRVRIITNRYRATDGGEQAAALFLKWLRTAGNRFAQCEVLVFCNSPSEVASLWSERTGVTNDAKTVSRFCQGESFSTLFPGIVLNQLIP